MQDRIDTLKAEKQAKIERAYTLALAGWSLYRIAAELGVTKEWLRTYAGLR